MFPLKAKITLVNIENPDTCFELDSSINFESSTELEIFVCNEAQLHKDYKVVVMFEILPIPQNL